MKRLLISMLVLVILLTALVHAQAKGNFVRGDKNFTDAVNAALDLVRTHDPSDYKATIAYISYIEQNHQPDKWSYVYGYDGICKIELTLDTPIVDAQWQIASDLVHEVSLCRDWWNDNTDNVRADEVHALVMQRQFLITAGGPQQQIDYMNMLISQNAPYFK